MLQSGKIPSEVLSMDSLGIEARRSCPVTAKIAQLACVCLFILPSLIFTGGCRSSAGQFPDMPPIGVPVVMLES